MRWPLAAALLALLTLTSCSGAPPAASWPGLVTTGDRAYVASGPHIYAVDLASGDEVWRYPAEPESSISFYAPPVVTDSGLVIAGGYDHIVYAIDQEQGREVWEYNGAQDRIIGGPAIAGDLVLIPVADGSLHALRLTDGIRQWSVLLGERDERTDQVERGGGLWSAPLVDGDRAYAASLDHHLYAVSLETGEVVWRVDIGSALMDTPALVDGLLLVGTFDRRVVALQPGSNQPAWSAATEGTVWGSPAVAEGAVYFGDVTGVVYALDPSQGRELWRFSQSSPVVPTPATANGQIYFVTQSGEVFAKRAEDQAPLWQFSPNETRNLGQLLSEPVLAGELLLIASMGADSLVTAFDAASGQVRWTFSPAG